MQRLSMYFAVTCAIVFALVTGCGSPLPAASPRAESLLLAAGFKTVVASTDAQLKQIPTLPPGQVTVITQTGKNWFVYPDLPRNQVYAGTEKEYQAYLKLRTQNNLPDVDPMASYYRQDAQMRTADKQYASVPWNGWPQLDVLSW